MSMLRGSGVCYAAFLLLVSFPRRGQSQAVLEIDHAKPMFAMLRMTPTGSATAIRSGASLLRKWSDSLRVRVVNGNTAVYQYSVETNVVPPTAAKVPKLAVDFLKQLKPFLPEVALAAAGPVIAGRPRGMEATVTHSMLPSQAPAEASERLRSVWSAGQKAERALAVLDDRIYGPKGLQQSTALVLATLERMRSGDVELLARQLGDSLALASKGCEGAGAPDGLPLTGDVIRATQGVMQARRSLTTATAEAGAELYTLAPQRELRDSLRRVGTMADTALAAFEDVIASAYAFERLALSVARACASVNVKTVRMDTTRRILMLRMAPNSDPQIARTASRDTSTFSITLVDEPVRLYSLGASLLVAPNASYSLAGTRAATGGVEIFENGIKDQRFSWGLTFGVGWRLSTSISARGIRLWVPELTIPASTDVKSLGLGTGLSFGLVKIGAGALWVRHEELLGQRFGQVIPTANDLKKGDVYGRGRLYFSVSVFDVPPFSAVTGR